MVDLTKLWKVRDILPVIVVDNMSGKVIKHGYMNKDAFAYTLKSHRVWYYNLETKEVEKLHGIYVELIKKEKQAYEVYADAMKTVDEKGFEKSDKLFDEASKISDKYMSLKKEYGKKYGLSFTKKK